MFKPLLAAAAVFTLLFTIILLPQTAEARRCPIKMPETLLSLYRASDAIYVATFDRNEDGQIAADTTEYSIVTIKKQFTVSSVLKGENLKFYSLEEQDYRYKNQTEDTSAAVPEDDFDDGYTVSLKPGDSVLLFLKKGEDGTVSELTDYRDGIKKLDREQMSVYEARIGDLNSIFSGGAPDAARIVDWLVKCAQDPATRWEGTFELLQSFQNLAWREEHTKELAQRRANGETIDMSQEAPEQDEELFGSGDSTFARLLNESQKKILADILFESTPAIDEEKPKTIAGQREIIELLKFWADERLPGLLIDQLKAGSDDRYDTAETMERIAHLLENKELASLADNFSEIGYEDDDEEVRPVDAATDNGAQTAEAEKLSEPDKPQPKLRYKEVRANILEEFLMLSENALMKKQSERDIAAAK